MKSIKLIAKGILLWLTALVVLLFICSIDSIIDKSLFWFAIALAILAINIGLVLACLIYITEDEYKIISGYNLLSKILKLDKD